MRKYRKWPFSAAHRIKTLEPIHTEIGVIDKVIEVTKGAKYGQHRSGGLASPYGWSCRLSLFFLIIFGSRVRAQPTPGDRPLHIIYQSMRFRPRMSFWGFQCSESIFGELLPKKLPHFSTGIGIPSVNIQSNSFRTARPILVIRS
jgi:hypothetical protein